MLTQIHAVALAKFVFEARGIEPVANNLADKIRLCLDLRFLGPKQTGVAQFNDRPFALRRSLNCRVAIGVRTLGSSRLMCGQKPTSGREVTVPSGAKANED